MAKILVVDDEELARFTIREVLRTEGHEVVEAGNGNEGIDCLKAEPFDLVVTDIIMPEKEGVVMIIEIRRDFPDLGVIAISGGGRTHNLNFLELARKFGADKVLAKPFTAAELLQTVDECLIQLA